MKKVFATACMLLLFPSITYSSIAERVTRKQIGGIDVVVYPTSIKDVVTIVGALPGGSALALANKDNASVAMITAMMLDRGTVREDKFALAKELENVGATLKFTTDQQSAMIRGRCLATDLPLVVRLLSEELRTPAFAPAEFEKVRQEFIGKQKNELDDVESRAAEASNRTLFPLGNPNRQPSIEEVLAAAQTLTLDQVKAFHQRVYGPDHMTLVFVGDVAPTRIEDAVRKSFGGWKGGADYVRNSSPSTDPGPINREISVQIPGKASTTLVVGQATGVRHRDADMVPLMVGTAILGSGFTGRLMHTVRDKEGLTYGIQADLDDDTFVGGSWQVVGTFAPDLLSRGSESTHREIQHWFSDGVSNDELTTRKGTIVGRYKVGLADTWGLASKLLMTVLRGRDVAWLDEYPRAIEAVSVEQVNSAIKKHLDPQNMITVKAGTLPSK